MKRLIIAALVVLALASLVAAAKDNATDEGPKANSTKNMTFGQCVSEAAAVKNTCYVTVKESRASCIDAAQNATDTKAEEKSCKQAYKQEMRQCKAGFKQEKKECGRIEHSFLDSMKASFK